MSPNAQTRPKAETEEQTNVPATVRRVLQRVVLPADRDMDVLPLYVDRGLAHLDPEKSKRFTPELLRTMSMVSESDQLQPDDILDRHRLRVRHGHRVSYGTYFNAFAASYWRMWTVVSEVICNITLTGADSTIIVYRSMPDGLAQRVDSVVVADGEIEHTFHLPLKPFGDGGWYWFDVVAGRHGAVVEEATWLAEVPEHGRPHDASRWEQGAGWCPSPTGSSVRAQASQEGRKSRCEAVGNGTANSACPSA